MKVSLCVLHVTARVFPCQGLSSLEGRTKLRRTGVIRIAFPRWDDEGGHALILGEGDAALVVVEAAEGPSSDAESPGKLTHREFEWSGDPSLAGMTKTSTCALHETDREGCCHTSTCLLQLTVRGSLCRGVSSGPVGWTALRMKRDESTDTVLLLGLLAVRGFGGIWRNHATESMLSGTWSKVPTKKVNTGADNLPLDHSPGPTVGDPVSVTGVAHLCLLRPN